MDSGAGAQEPLDGATSDGVARDPSWDVLRGAFVCLMVICHVAAGTRLDAIGRIPPWLDGATGFFAVSGLLAGRSLEAVVSGAGAVRPAVGNHVRRLGHLARWTIGPALLVMAGRAATGRDLLEPGVDLPAAVWRVVTLRPTYSYIGVLPAFMFWGTLALVGALALRGTFRAGRRPLLAATLITGIGVVYWSQAGSSAWTGDYRPAGFDLVASAPVFLLAALWGVNERALPGSVRRLVDVIGAAIAGLLLLWWTGRVVADDMANAALRDTAVPSLLAPVVCAIGVHAAFAAVASRQPRLLVVTRPLADLGRHAVVAYAVQGVAALAVREVVDRADSSARVVAALAVMVMAWLSCLAWERVRSLATR